MNSDRASLRKRLEQRRAALRQDEQVMEPHWRELREYIQPFRGRFAGEQANQTAPSMAKIIRAEALRARRTLSAGMLSGLTSPSRQWFKLSVHDVELTRNHNVQMWCDEVQRRMMAVMAGSSFYHALHSLYDEVAVFGTGVLIIMPDYDEFIKCRTMTAGTYYLGKAQSDRVDSFYRDMQLTAGAIVSEFGEENCSVSVQRAARDNPDTLFEVRHAIEPDPDPSARFPWRSVYWEPTAPTDKILRIGGYNSFPVQTPRWHVIDADVYGYGPGSEVLPDVKALQVMERDRLEGVRKQVAPPVVADVSLKGRGVKTSPNGITYVQSGAVGPMIAPLYSVPLNLADLQLSIQDVVRNINSTLYVDLFLMLQQQDGPQMTAREVVERHEEKMLALGPVLERLEWELLTPAIERIYTIMEDAGKIPEPPEEIQGQELKIEYVSILAQAQRMMGLKSVEQLVSFAGSLAAVSPEVMDVIDMDAAVREYGDMVGSPQKILRGEKDVQALRAQREQRAMQMQQAQQEAAAVQTLSQGAQGAKTLSEIDPGSGALQALMGTNVTGELT